MIQVDPPGGTWPQQIFGWVELEVSGTEMTTTRFEFLPSGYRFTKGENRRLYDTELFE